jgi:propanol-preferring alcohol dehydrogenase
VNAVVLERPGHPVKATTLPDPEPASGELFLDIEACAVCRTDLHLRDAEIAATKLPIVLGHQIVGRTPEGRRVGVPWLGWTDQTCSDCKRGRENLCANARFTGRDIDGGFAEYTVADERFCLPLPDDLDAQAAAPLLCGGLIGYRALKLAGDATSVGLYGFGSAAHQICQVAAFQGREVYAFTRAGDSEGQEFARSLGARWAGAADETPPEPLEAAIIFAPVGALVPTALKALAPGGTVVCAGIHMSDIPAMPYSDLYMERSIRSVANLTRSDGAEFLKLASQAQINQAEQALDDLRAGRIKGTAVLVPRANP